MWKWKLISENLTKSLKELGTVGGLIYIAGFISLLNVFVKNTIEQQILFGVIGLMMFIISSFIVYFRMKLQKEKEEYLIKKITENNNKLSDRINNNCTNEQSVSITQTIWQNNKDLIEKIVGISISNL